MWNCLRVRTIFFFSSFDSFFFVFVRSKLESCLGRWSRFDEEVQRATQWMKSMEMSARKEGLPRATLLAKKDQVDKFRVLQTVHTAELI